MVGPSLEAALEELPLVAILRGLQPVDAAQVARTLVDAGFRIVEVPLNSPSPFDSLAALVETVGEQAVVGAGTVLSSADARQVSAAGGSLVVAPNTDLEVARACAEAGLAWVPGVLTPTEAFEARKAGARALKLFPAGASSPAFLSALSTVLPTDVPILAVGGISPTDLSTWWAAGAQGFGVGSALYRPERSLEELRRRAEEFVAAARSLHEARRVN